LHHRCRSGVRALTPRQAARRKPERRTTEGIDSKPQQGFGLSPKHADTGALKPAPDKVDPQLLRELNRKRTEAGVPA
jgi:hypothetical protein